MKYITLADLPKNFEFLHGSQTYKVTVDGRETVMQNKAGDRVFVTPTTLIHNLNNGSWRMLGLTPCQELGYKIGDKFVVTAGSHWKEGDIITLVKDDGSTCPKFKNADDELGYKMLCYVIPYKIKAVTSSVYKNYDYITSAVTTKVEFPVHLSSDQILRMEAIAGEGYNE